jgi:hypothetical protein
VLSALAGGSAKTHQAQSVSKRGWSGERGRDLWQGEGKVGQGGEDKVLTQGRAILERGSTLAAQVQGQGSGQSPSHSQAAQGAWIPRAG